MTGWQEWALVDDGEAVTRSAAWSSRSTASTRASTPADEDLRARIVICGAISQDDGTPTRGPRNYLQLVVRRATMQGFLVLDVVEGFEQVPAAFRRPFSGEKRGKDAVRLA